MEKEFKQMERELTEKANRVEMLMAIIKQESSRAPASINEAVDIKNRLDNAKDELVAIVGMNEYQMLLKEAGV